MKWIYISINKKFCRVHVLVPFSTRTDILHKSKKYQGVKEKKHDFEMSMPSRRMCCTIMVHRSTN